MSSRPLRVRWTRVLDSLWTLDCLDCGRECCTVSPLENGPGWVWYCYAKLPDGSLIGPCGWERTAALARYSAICQLRRLVREFSEGAA